jgi:ABC-type transport system involved in multi-copper enzyme maturation permease subunit
MKALVEKEIRMLLPAFAGALVLAIVPDWLFQYDRWSSRDYSVYFLGFGVALLALSSFGREIGLRTLPFMLAQPLDRSRIWRAKGGVLGFFVAVTFIGWWLSRALSSRYQPVPEQDLAEAWAFVAVMVAGALWMTLLLRQVAAAFWLTLLVPMVTAIFVRAIGGNDWVVFTALGLYAVAGLFMARRQFVGLQDTAWTGGIVTFGRRRAVAEGPTSRARRPWVTLIRKELKLHEFTLAGMAALFVVHLGVVGLRKLGANTFTHTTLSTLEMFGVVWIFVPLVAGSQSVAEERQLGILDGLLCLPFSRRVQFGVKLIFAVIIGGVLSATLLWTVEGIARAIGVGPRRGILGMELEYVPVLSWFMAISLAGFWASTLTRSVVQAMAAGVVISFVFAWILRLNVMLPQSVLPPRWALFVDPAIIAAVLWMAYGNFRGVFESGLRWRRNVFGLIAVLVLTTAFWDAVYYRVWEIAMPTDGEHGLARIPTATTSGKNFWSFPAKLKCYGGTGLAVVLPDGRLWTDRIAHDRRWISLAGDQFVPGSNWVDAIADSRDTVAIRSDGTLWVSEKPRPPWLREHNPSPEPPVPLVQFGMESNWQSVTRYPLILLKRDGTLRKWGNGDIDGANYEGLRAYTPQRLDAGSDWDRILRGTRFEYGWKRDGSAWAVQTEVSPTNRSDIELPDLAGVRLRSLNTSPFGIDIDICVRDNGTLWYWPTPVFFWRVPNADATKPRNLNLVRIGRESDWAAVAGGFYQIVALKTDGTLWSWDLLRGQQPAPLETLQEQPKRLGTHSDWVAVGCWFNQAVGLSADGTFWDLPRTGVHIGFGYDDEMPLLAPSRRASKIENIFGAAE